MKKKIKIITMDEANGLEEQWRTVFEAVKMLETIILSMMGEFDENSLNPLQTIQVNLHNAKMVALEQWQGLNSLIGGQKH